MCNGMRCKENIPTNEKLKEISKNYRNSKLHFLVSERGFDTTYINASIDNGVLYVVRYSGGR